MDEIDRKLMTILASDPRVHFRELAYRGFANTGRDRILAPGDAGPLGILTTGLVLSVLTLA